MGLSVSIYEPPAVTGELSDLTASENVINGKYFTVRMRLDFKAVPRDSERILIRQYVRGGEERTTAKRFFEARIKDKFVDSKRLEWLCEEELDKEFLQGLIMDGSPFRVEEIMELLKDYRG